MENGGVIRWGFGCNDELTKASAITVRGVLNTLMDNLKPEDSRPVIPLGHGDPSSFPCFRTTPLAVDAVCDAVRSAKYNGYGSTVGIPPARRCTFLLTFLGFSNF